MTQNNIKTILWRQKFSTDLGASTRREKPVSMLGKGLKTISLTSGRWSESVPVRKMLVEAWGRGMPLILKNAPDVVFREVGNLFIVSFNRASYTAETSEQLTEKFGKESSGKKVRESSGKEIPEKKFLKGSSGKTAERILNRLSVVKGSLTAQVAHHVATVRKFRRVRLFQLASYSEIPNSSNAVIRNSRITDTDPAVWLIPSNSMGLECPPEVCV